MGSRRYYENTLPDLPEGSSSLLDSNTKKLNPELSAEIKKIAQSLWAILEANISSNTRDSSVYTGAAGLAYLLWMQGEKENDAFYTQKGLKLAQQSLKKSCRGDVTFLCGDSGPLCVAALLYHSCGNSNATEECVAAVLKMLPTVIDQQSDLPDELLYGRVGYLYSLLLLDKHIPGSVQSHALKQISEQVMTSGQNLSKARRFPAPLLWEWCDELYVGGAHGIAGILYLLLQIANAVIRSGEVDGNPPLMWTWHNKKYLGGAHGVSGILYLLLQVKRELNIEQLQLIRQTLDYLLSISYPSGNFPSSINSSEDRLVHWCHGAPGVVQLFLCAYEIWKHPTYLSAAEKCGDIVWRRGLLKKGYGICHGVAGNAYTFLALYQATGNEFHLHRAIQFARWCSSFDSKQERTPDRPFSLFEGIAGTIYFLNDIQDPLQAMFPAFTINPFKCT